MTSQRRADARSLDHISWEFAVAEAVGGAPQLLALLLRQGGPPDDLRDALADLVLRLPRAKRPTRTPRFTPSQARTIRSLFAALTSADPDSPRRFPGLTHAEARERLAVRLGVSPGSLRDVLEYKTKGYRE